MDNFAVNNLCLCSRMIEPSENVYEISITKDFVIITAEYALQSKSDTNSTEIFTNNINAYDWDGNHLWNIADIIGDLKIPYYGGLSQQRILWKIILDLTSSGMMIRANCSVVLRVTICMLLIWIAESWYKCLKQDRICAKCFNFNKSWAVNLPESGCLLPKGSGQPLTFMRHHIVFQRFHRKEPSQFDSALLRQL